MKMVKNVNGLIYPPHLIWRYFMKKKGYNGKWIIIAAIFLNDLSKRKKDGPGQKM